MQDQEYIVGQGSMDLWYSTKSSGQIKTKGTDSLFRSGGEKAKF